MTEALPRGLVIGPMRSTPGLVATVSRWRHEEWLHEFDFTYEATVAQLEELLANPAPGEVALLAEADGVPVGTCLLVQQELEQKHDLTPWLAGLYVVPEWRGRGIASALVRAIEDHARAEGYSRIHLYTSVAEDLYAALGWQVEERFDWDGDPSTLMWRDL